jgi:hypothetical protein
MLSLPRAADANAERVIKLVFLVRFLSSPQCHQLALLILAAISIDRASTLAMNSTGVPHACAKRSSAWSSISIGFARFCRNARIDAA